MSVRFGLNLAVAVILSFFAALAPAIAQNSPSTIGTMTPDELKAFLTARLPKNMSASAPVMSVEGRPMVRIHTGNEPKDDNVYFVVQLIGCKNVAGAIRCPALYFVHYMLVPAAEYKTEAASSFAISWIARVVGPGRIIPKGVRFDGKAELMIDHWITIEGGVTPDNLWRQVGEFEYTIRQVKSDWARR